MKSQNHLLDLIIAQASGNISPEEKKELDVWKLENNANNKQYNDLLRLCLKSEFALKWKDINVDKAKNKHFLHFNKKTQIYPLFAKFAAAVIIILIVVGSIYIYKETKTIGLSQFSHIAPGDAKAVLTLSDGSNINIGDSSINIIDIKSGIKISDNKKGSIRYNAPIKLSIKESLYNILEVKRGGEYHLVLSDGTKVWLNSETILKYPVFFSGNTREVQLKGEAYFEVAHDTTKIFYVKTQNSTVKVLGTTFNVQVYEEGESQITLVTGKVSLEIGKDAYSLTPGNQAIINNTTNEVVIEEVDVSQFTSWKDGVFKFVNLPMEDLTKVLSRWYDVEFTFKTENLKQEKFSGAITKYRTLDYILELIEKTNDLKFGFDYEKIIIKER